MKEPIIATDVYLTERPDGTRAVVISTQREKFEAEFTAELWEKLSGMARWFAKEKLERSTKRTAR